MTFAIAAAVAAALAVMFVRGVTAGVVVWGWTGLFGVLCLCIRLTMFYLVDLDADVAARAAWELAGLGALAVPAAIVGYASERLRSAGSPPDE